MSKREFCYVQCLVSPVVLFQCGSNGVIISRLVWIKFLPLSFFASYDKTYQLRNRSIRLEDLRAQAELITKFDLDLPRKIDL